MPITSFAWETGDGRPPVTAASFDYVYPAAGDGWPDALTLFDVAPEATLSRRIELAHRFLESRSPPRRVTRVEADS